MTLPDRVAYGLLLAGVTLSALAQVFLKLAAARVAEQVQTFRLDLTWGVSFARALVNIHFASGIACFAISVLLWLAGLSRINLSVAYPFTALGIVLTTLCGSLLFNETITPGQWAGICVIILGILLLVWR
jgi:multidrug transporter EmrE-like cation transporter